uniref:Uncharacterized protein n=1 Tax=Arundo donax TaxID=35708 RepID=A0A0A9H2C2_ARUDO
MSSRKHPATAYKATMLNVCDILNIELITARYMDVSM